MGREVWVVFEMVLYFEKKWGGMDGYLDCLVVVMRMRSDVLMSLGLMLVFFRLLVCRCIGCFFVVFICVFNFFIEKVV